MSDAPAATPPAATPPAATATPPAATPPAAGTPWYASYDQESQGWLQNRGLDKLPADQALPELVKGFRAAEKHIGVPTDQLLRLPKEGDTAAWDATYSKLGRPADPSKYDLKLPEKHDPKFAEWARGAFHKLGLNNTQANEMLAQYTAFTAEYTKAADAKYSAEVAADTTKLNQEWGAAKDKNVQVARGAAKELGIPGEAIDALEKTLGYAGVMRMFYKIGAAFGEDTYTAGGPASFAGTKTPVAAQQKIQQLRMDMAFVKRLQSGDVAAKREWDEAHAQAYPNPAAA